MSKSIEQQVADLFATVHEYESVESDSTAEITTPEQWVASYRRRVALAQAANKTVESVQGLAMVEFGELAAAQGWTSEQLESRENNPANEVLAVALGEQDKSVYSKWRSAAMPQVRCIARGLWEEAQALANKGYAGKRAFNAFTQLMTAARKYDGTTPPNEIAAAWREKKDASKATAESFVGTRRDFAKARARDVKKDAKRNGHVLAEMFPANVWADYCRAVAALVASVPSPATVESDSTKPAPESKPEPAQETTPDVAALFASMSPEEQKGAMAFAAMLQKK